MHPHDVHDVQADTGADPGYTATPGHQVEGFSAIDRVHTTVVDWHDSDADHEKNDCHGNAICHVGPGGLGVTKYLKEPAETQNIVKKQSLAAIEEMLKTITSNLTLESCYVTVL